VKLPSREKCMEMLAENHNPPNVVKHSLLVNRVANYLAKKIKEAGKEVSLSLVDRASLLHDVAKYRTLDSDIRHGEAGYELLMERGYPEIAEIVREHALSEILDRNMLKSLESRIVYYADKRVRKDEIVSLEERFEYLRERYGRKSPGIMEVINRCYEPCRGLEEELFSLARADSSLEELKKSGGAKDEE
jgi:putative nucleotidyltransferase with HDIG domain